MHTNFTNKLELDSGMLDHLSFGKGDVDCSGDVLIADKDGELHDLPILCFDGRELSVGFIFQVDLDRDVGVKERCEEILWCVKCYFPCTSLLVRAYH